MHKDYAIEKGNWNHLFLENLVMSKLLESIIFQIY